ncbi:hypothetical protein B1B05_13110 [Domibacillus enclensis]|nr:hypothetical protein B1B05_13110 [Domibacillus enclensis]
MGSVGKVVKNILILYPSLIIIFILSVFIDFLWLDYLVGILAFASLLTAARYAKGLYFYSGLLFSFIGTGLFLVQKLPWHTYFLQFDSMLGVMSLFVVLPFLNTIIRVGHYDTNLNALLRHDIHTLDKLYRRSFLVSHMLGLFLNIATIPLVKNSLQQSLKKLPKETAHSFLAGSVLRGYALCLAWSPLEVMVIAALDMTGKAYYEVVVPMIMIVVLFAAIDYTISFFKYRTYGLHIADSLQSASNVRRKMIEMAGMLLIFIFLTSVFQHVFQKGYLLSVVLAILPISCLWALFIKKPKRYVRVAFPAWKERTSALSNYFFMFLSAGLFVNMLSASGALSIVQDGFQLVSGQPFLLYLMIGLFFFATSLTGFHPLVSITLLGELLRPILPEVSSVPLTIVLIVCSLATVMYSPFNLSVSILSELIRVNPFHIVRWNVRYALLYMLSSIIIAYSIHIFLTF